MGSDINFNAGRFTGSRYLGARRIFFPLLMAVAALSSVGCSCTPEMKKFDVKVTLDDSLKDERGVMRAIEINMIGADETLLKRWMNKPVDEYWAESDLRTSRDKFVMTFSPDERSKMLSKTDPIWDTWKSHGAMDLVIIAFIPGMRGNGAGVEDPRRLDLTLSSCRWKSGDTINIVVQSSGIISLNQPAPPDK